MQRTLQRKYLKNLAVKGYLKKIKEVENKKKLLEINDGGNRKSSVNEARGTEVEKIFRAEQKNPKQPDNIWGKVFLKSKKQ